MDKILDFILGLIEKNETLGEDEKEEVRYGLELILMKLLFWILVTLTGIVMGSFWECVLYNLLFFPIRSYAGGYHAKTRTRCMIQSIITVVLALTVIKVCRENLWLTAVLAVMTLMSGTAVWLLSPVDTENRQLDEDEIKRFGGRARVVIAIFTAVGAAAYFLGYRTAACTVMAAITTGGILVLAEYLKKKSRNL